jgi:hypothetical protein
VDALFSQMLWYKLELRRQARKLQKHLIGKRLQ